MNLIIVESPTKANTLSRFLGKDYDVVATKGHIKDLPKSQLGIDIEHRFIPEYIFVEKRKEDIAKIKKLSHQAKSIYIASDPDREGEAIAAHVQEMLTDNKPSARKNIHRITFHEITKDAVEEAIADPHKVNQNLVDAQIARRVLDRLVGYKLSPLLWKKVRRGLSAGRVQSVAVRLIVERESEIEAFKSEEYWEILATVKSQKNKNQFDVSLVKINDKTAVVNNEKTAKAILSDLKRSKYVVKDIKKREVQKHSVPPFTTSTMTQRAASSFGWSAKKTMSVAQSLYEEGLITYHRTDSVNISQAAVAKARALIESKYGKAYLPEKPKFYKKTSKLVQEAHEAIRPTDVNQQSIKLNSKFAKDGEKLYGLIWKRFLASQMTSAIYDETTIEVEALAGAKSDHYLLRASGQIVKFDGWKTLYPKNDKTEEDLVILPDVDKGEDLDLVKLDSEQKFTQPPARYNEASLIKTLEKLGIGRPSTYAPTISTIQVRTYIEKKEGKFFPTPVGVAVNDFLTTNFSDIVDYDFTADMEDQLDKVASGDTKWDGVIGKFWKPFDTKLVKVEENAKRVKIAVEKLNQKCPECTEGELVLRHGRFGKFISCSRFPDCKYTAKYVEKIDMKCPKCEKGDVIVKKTSKGRPFYGCSTYPDCDWASWKNPQMVEKKDNL